MLTMAEIAMSMKFTEKVIEFGYQNHPYVALLQMSARVFYRAFPSVVSRSTLRSAATLFGITFEGLVPMHMTKETFQGIRISLERCAMQEMRKEKHYKKILAELCPEIRSEVEMQANSSIANVNLNPGGGGGGGGAQMKTDFGGPHNIVIELMWKVVQFVHANCLSAADHFPNLHHAYTVAMLEMLSQPAVQLLWYQQGKYDYRQLGKVMIHIFPDLADHVLPTFELLFKKLKFETHFNILARPKIS